MAEDRKVIVGSVAGGIASIQDIDDGRWTPGTTLRNKARTQVLWMVGQARRAAKNGRADDARWWSHRAISALWNMN